jgi:formylglycine-generating enzyme required for sulfatase activity
VGGLKEYHLRHLLEELAYQAHQSQQSPDGRGLLHKGVVRERLIDLFKEFGLSEDEASVKAVFVLNYLIDESGLLLYEGGDLYALPHLTYEEYLSGCHLVQQGGEEDFRVLADRHWRKDAARWREVIFLGLGWMVRNRNQNDAAAWLRFLLEKPGRLADEQQRAAFFAAECLHEMGGKASLIGVNTLDITQLWQQMAAALVPVVEGTTLPATERVQAGRILGSLGDPRPGVCTLPPDMVRIEGGIFPMGDKNKEHQVTLPTFEIARYPLTNAQWELFIKAKGYNPNAPWWDEAGQAWLRKDGRTQPSRWNDERFGIARPNHPVVGISWYEAVAFCRWLTQHPTYNQEKYVYLLPSEAEWEYAARRATRRTYPWGNEEPDAERANFDSVYNNTTAVGCFAPGATPKDQIHDLAGNVWEWTRSVYRDYPYDPTDGREDKDNPTDKTFVLRGGGWGNQSIDLRASDRVSNTPVTHDFSIGVRLARRLP